MIRSALSVSLSAFLAVSASGIVHAQDATQEATPTPPPLQIIAPEPGCVATVGEKLQVMLLVQPDLDPTTVAVLCDDTAIGMLSQGPFVVEWDTSGMDAGDHVIRAFAYLDCGDKIGATPVTVKLYKAEAPAMEPVPLQPQEPAPPPVILKEGTPVLLATTEKMVSGKVIEGSMIRLRAMRDVLGPDGCIVIPFGSLAHGKVTRSRRRGAFGKAGQLEFTIEGVEAADGTSVPLRAFQEMAGRDKRIAAIAGALTISVAALFYPGGDDVEVPEGTEVTAYVDHDTEVREPLPARAPGEMPVPVPTGIEGEVTTVAVVAIESPANGRHVLQGAHLRVVATAEPQSAVVELRWLLDGTQVASLEVVEPSHLRTKKWTLGDHTLEAEALFSNRFPVRSAAVRVHVVAGE